MMPIGQQLGRSFRWVALSSILLILILSNLGMNLYFTNYLRSARQTEDQAIAAYTEQLRSDDGTLDVDDHMSIEHYAFTAQAEVILEDPNGHVVMSTREGYSPQTSSERSQYMDLNGFSYREYPLGPAGAQGTLIIGRPKSIFSAPSDRRFLLMTNLIYILAAILSLLLGRYLRDRLKDSFLKPIYAIQANARTIEQGDYSQVREVTSDTNELDELARAIHSMAKRLEEQENLRKRLTSDIAHELRTPLSTISSHLEAFMDGVWEPTPQRLALLQDEIRRLTNLIRDLGDLSYLESGQLQMTMKPVDLSQLLTSVMGNFEPLFQTDQKDLQGNLETGVLISGDRDRLNQVFINLVANGLRYTNPGGTVTLTLTTTPAEAHVTVADDGIGIASADLPFVFERFYRSDRSRSRGTGGKGIGLTIARAVVEAHGGHIHIDSAVGKGTRVTVTLKRLPDLDQ